MLNQDTAKTFLFKCEPEKLYTFFMKATQLETCKNDYNEAHIELGQTQLLVQEKKKSLPYLKKEVDKWEKKHQFHMNLKQKKIDLQYKKGELGWALVRDMEHQAEDIKEKMEVQVTKVKKAADNISVTEAKLKDQGVEKKKIEKNIQDIAQGQPEEEAKLDVIWNNVKEKLKDVRDRKAKADEEAAKKSGLEREIHIMESQVAKLRVEGTSEYEREHRRRLEQISQLQEQLNKVSAESSTTETHLGHLDANRKDCDQRLMSLKAAKVKESGMRTKYEGSIEQLRRSGQNRLAQYGPGIDTLVAEINKSNRFKQKPIGPLGMFLKIKEGTPENVRDALDHEIKGVVGSFLVSCNEDRMELFNMFERLRLQRKPVVYTCQFTDKKHKIEDNRVYSETFPVLIDHLVIENPNVFNRIVDTCQLERIIFIPTTREAQQCLSRSETVPRNLHYATVANSYQYYPAPNYRSYYFDQRPTG